MKSIVRLLLLTIVPLSVSSGVALGQFEAWRNLTRSAPEVPVKTIAYFKIKGPLTETPTSFPPLFGNEPPMSLKGLLDGMRDARLDNDVVGIVIDLQEAVLGLGQINEIHHAMQRFAAVDKEVFIHADSLRTPTYALATGASHLSVVPTGDIWLIGLYGETPYLRGTLDMIGCVADFEQCGDFKSAAESLTRTGPSPESLQMKKWLLDGLYDDLTRLIAQGRGISPVRVRALIDNGPYTAEAALKLGLIDSVKHRQDFIADIKSQYGDDIEFVTDYGKDSGFEIPDDNIFAAFEFLMQLFNPKPKEYTEPSIAIVYVDGTIQMGTAKQSPFGSSTGAFSASIRRALDEAADEETVKAVVLRIDSPGGSALASEIILDATRRVAAKKPLIVSMGNVAGSGGYYVACAAEAIFANPNTITASIGVIGGKLVTTGMWNKLGVNWHPVQRGKMAGMMSSAAKFSDEERAKIREYMTTIYDIFKGHVVKARGDKLSKPIDEIAGGRVFTGAQALDLGLVDKLGGLDDAVKYAAKRASLGEYEVRVIPEPPTIFDLFRSTDDDDEYLSSPRAQLFALSDLPFVQAALPALARIDPLRFNAVLNAMKRIELIHKEGVIMMMPDELLIR